MSSWTKRISSRSAYLILYGIIAYPSGSMTIVRSDIVDSTSSGVTTPSWRRVRVFVSVGVLGCWGVGVCSNWLYCFFSSRERIGRVRKIARTRWIGSMYLCASSMIIVTWYGARRGVIVTILMTDLIRAYASLPVSIGDASWSSAMSPCSIRLPYGTVTTAPIGTLPISPAP